MRNANFPQILSAYLELTKPRILLLVLVTTALGFFASQNGIHSWLLFAETLAGVAFVCGGSAALNHYLERDIDKRMQRTKNRPLPRGILAPNNALLFGVLLVLGGVFFLYWKVNLLTAFLSLLTAFLYVLVYTPMKRISWLNTSLGAIPGALPPVGGWTAATGELSTGAGILFAILFFWQHPHFYSIAWMCREDYRQAGFKMLPVVDPDGKSTFLQIIVCCLLLTGVSLLPTFWGLSGNLYFWGALLAGGYLLQYGVRLRTSRSDTDARSLLKASVFYLPALLFLIVIDVTF